MMNLIKKLNHFHHVLCFINTIFLFIWIIAWNIQLWIRIWLYKIVAELMILGFISLLLTFGQSYIARICIPLKVADTMLPCTVKDVKDEEDDSTSHRRLLWNDRRSLAAASDYKCKTVSISSSSPLDSSSLIDSRELVIIWLRKWNIVYILYLFSYWICER